MEKCPSNLGTERPFKFIRNPDYSLTSPLWVNERSSCKKGFTLRWPASLSRNASLRSPGHSKQGGMWLWPLCI